MLECSDNRTVNYLPLCRYVAEKSIKICIQIRSYCSEISPLKDFSIIGVHHSHDKVAMVSKVQNLLFKTIQDLKKLKVNN
jgi:hypothetical protein